MGIRDDIRAARLALGLGRAAASGLTEGFREGRTERDAAREQAQWDQSHPPAPLRSGYSRDETDYLNYLDAAISYYWPMIDANDRADVQRFADGRDLSALRVAIERVSKTTRFNDLHARQAFEAPEFDGIILEHVDLHALLARADGLHPRQFEVNDFVRPRKANNRHDSRWNEIRNSAGTAREENYFTGLSVLGLNANQITVNSDGSIAMTPLGAMCSVLSRQAQGERLQRRYGIEPRPLSFEYAPLDGTSRGLVASIERVVRSTHRPFTDFHIASEGPPEGLRENQSVNRAPDLQ